MSAHLLPFFKVSFFFFLREKSTHTAVSTWAGSQGGQSSMLPLLQNTDTHRNPSSHPSRQGSRPVARGEARPVCC